MLNNETRTVNAGDAVIDLRDIEAKGVVYSTGPIVYVDWEFQTEDDDGRVSSHRMVDRCEHVPYRVWQVEWSDSHGAWTIDQQGISAHQLAMER